MSLEGKIESSIRQKLNEQFSPSIFDLENESRKHRLDPDGETHFKITLVSETFEGQRAVKRHQAVYGCLADELEQGVHSLVLHLFTPQEWQESEQKVPRSAPCTH